MIDKDYIKDGVRYISLPFSCPNCVEMNRWSPGLYWTHYDNNCGGDMLLGDNGHLLCDKCGQHQIVTKCRFLCPNHIEGLKTEMISFEHNNVFPSFKLITFAGEVFKNILDAHGRYVRKLTRSLDDMLDENNEI